MVAIVDGMLPECVALGFLDKFREVVHSTLVLRAWFTNAIAKSMNTMDTVVRSSGRFCEGFGDRICGALNLGAWLADAVAEAMEGIYNIVLVIKAPVGRRLR